jgi:hypothetical protein
VKKYSGCVKNLSQLQQMPPAKKNPYAMLLKAAKAAEASMKKVVKKVAKKKPVAKNYPVKNAVKKRVSTKRIVEKMSSTYPSVTHNDDFAPAMPHHIPPMDLASAEHHEAEGGRDEEPHTPT